MLDLAHIGERIRECRKKKMMTIRVLGEYTGLSAGYLSMLEQNKTSPNVDSLARICEALDIDIQYALEGEMPGKTVIHREEMSKHLYPEENMIEEILERCKNRGNKDDFLKGVKDAYYRLYPSKCKNIIWMKRGEYLEDILIRNNFLKLEDNIRK